MSEFFVLAISLVPGFLLRTVKYWYMRTGVALHMLCGKIHGRVCIVFVALLARVCSRCVRGNFRPLLVQFPLGSNFRVGPVSARV